MFTDTSGLLAEALNNQFLTGGLALAALGAAFGLARVVWRSLWRALAARLWLTVTLDNRSDAFRHLLLWLDSVDAFGRSRRLRAGGAEASDFGPAEGLHWCRIGPHIVLLTRELDTKARFGHAQRPLETVTLTVLGGSRALVRGWLAKGRALAEAVGRRGPVLHTYAQGYWSELGDMPARSLATVVTTDDRLDRLLVDVRWFYGAERWYAARGVPWRRGYLLHGPPGTGKSSVIRAVASELGLDVATLDIARRGLGDDELRECMGLAPRSALLAIEDIDAAFAERDAQDALGGISFSGLLNAIDGVAAQEGRALFMTTNHIERLDPALIRPGRADVHVELGLVGASEAEELFRRFFPDHASLAARFAERIGARQVSPAALQGWLMRHLDRPVDAADTVGLFPAPNVAAE